MERTNFHSFYGGIKWRLAPGGIDVEGSGLERSAGRPATIEKIWSTYRDDIEYVAWQLGLPVEYILATIATESSGNPLATRHEPGYLSDKDTPHRVSTGLMQTLHSTASEVMRFPVTGDWLKQPRNSILAGSLYIKQQAKTTLLDGPMVFAAYNAGGVYLQNGPHNRWKMRQYPIGTGEHCDRAVKWLNDAVCVTMGGFVTKNGWDWFLRSVKHKLL